jgi:2-polyprenyl-3-methyl-5-hydroxy-6-metoxy-1,4-benzoquinol methylase
MSYYDEYLSTHFRRVTGLDKKDFECERKAFARECAKLLPEDKDSKILDVGCGVGHFLYFLDHSGYRNCLGIDISPEQVAFCRDNVTDNVEMADAFEFLKLKPDYYDVVFSNNFIEHLDANQLLQFILLVNFSLKKGGTVILRTPNMASPFASGAFWTEITHITPFTERSLVQLLSLGKFDEIRTYPAACRLPHRLVLTIYKLIILSFWVRPPRIVTPAILGVGRKS